jgi:DNA-binding HxlR family transcriptional regulator
VLGRTYDNQVCSVARTLGVIGERWTLLIVRDALLGMHRFEQFQRSLGVARNVLTDRLASLVDDGILDRVPYQANPPRYDYRLTPKGRELRTVVLALMDWGDQYLVGPEGPPRVVRHSTCGGHVTPRLVCDDCGPVPATEVDNQPLFEIPGPDSVVAREKGGARADVGESA